MDVWVVMIPPTELTTNIELAIHAITTILERPDDTPQRSRTSTTTWRDEI